MADRNGTSGGGVIAIAAIAFILGRCSAAPETPVPPAINVTPLAAASDEPPMFRTVPPGSEEAEADAALSTAEPSAAPAAALMSEPAEEPVVQADDDESVYYARCADARASGAAPIHEGEPGYASHLDRDRDGVACE